MKLSALFCVLILSSLLSCTGDPNSKAEVGKALLDFTINDQNATPYKSGEQLPSDITAGQDYIIAAINENIKIQVGLSEDNKLPVLWEVDDSPIQGKEVEKIFTTPGFKKIVLQVPGYEEVVKFVNVKNEVAPAPEVKKEVEPAVVNTPDLKKTAEKPLSPEKNKTILPLKKEDKKTTIPKKDQPKAPVIVGKTETPKAESKPANVKVTTTPVKTTTAINAKPSDFNSGKEEGAKLVDLCGDHTFIDVAMVAFNPVQDVELGSLYVYTSQSGNVDIVLLENNNQVDKLSGRSVNKGRAQIRLSTLNYTLRAGRSYTLKINGSGGVNFANLAKCKSGGGGSILQPSYSNSVAIFNIKFNY